MPALVGFPGRALSQGTRSSPQLGHEPRKPPGWAWGCPWATQHPGDAPARREPPAPADKPEEQRGANAGPARASPAPRVPQREQFLKENTSSDLAPRKAIFISLRQTELGRQQGAQSFTPHDTKGKDAAKDTLLLLRFPTRKYGRQNRA